ncbi:hypothetical protein ACG9HA_000991 [Klebsiella aerogenes]
MNAAELKIQRDKALAAYNDALDAQSMSMNGRNLTRQSLDSLWTAYLRWDRLYQLKIGKRKPYALAAFRRG